MRSDTRRHAMGFTLLELLVVLSVLSVVTTTGVVMLIRLMDYHRNVSAGEAAATTLESILEQFRSDAASIISGPNHARLEPEADGLMLLVASPAADGGRDPALPVRIQYRLIRDQGGTTLVREERTDASSSGRVTLRAEVADATFMVAAGTDWRERWTKEDLPDAVRLVVTASPDFRTRPAGRSVTRFVDVNLGSTQP